MKSPYAIFRKTILSGIGSYTLKVSLKYNLSDLRNKFPVLGKTGSE